MLYVQYGSGWCAPSEWKNFDASPTLRWERIPWLGRLYTKNDTRFPENVEYGDIVKGLPIEGSSADGVFSSHVLEHLARQSVTKALANTFRILRPGGVFRVVVPDLRWRVEVYLNSIESSVYANDDFFKSMNMGLKQPMNLKRALFKWLGHEEHLWMYDFCSMKNLLHEAGFVSIRRANFKDSGNPMFDQVERADRFFQDGHDELALEARRP